MGSKLSITDAFGSKHRENKRKKLGSAYEQRSNRHARTSSKTQVHLDRIRGCLIGGAAGDALGYPVEFFSEHTLWARYGDNGIQEYELDPVRDKALISDDTQMTLFTANGILYGETRMATRGIGSAPHCYVSRSYQDWLFTQQASFSERSTAGGISWLLEIPELYRHRAPGNTCLSALTQQKRNADGPLSSYIDHPQTTAKAAVASCASLRWD